MLLECVFDFGGGDVEVVCDDEFFDVIDDVDEVGVVDCYDVFGVILVVCEY